MSALLDVMEKEVEEDPAYKLCIMMETLTFKYGPAELARSFPNKAASKLYIDADFSKPMSNKQSRALVQLRGRLKAKLIAKQASNDDQSSSGLTSAMGQLIIADRSDDDASAMSLDTAFKSTTNADAVGQGLHGSNKLQTIVEDSTGPTIDDILLFGKQCSIIGQDNLLNKMQKDSLLQLMAVEMHSTNAVGQMIRTFCTDLEECTKKIEGAQSGPERISATESKQILIDTVVRYVLG